MLGEVGELRRSGGGDLRRHALPLLHQVQAQHPSIDGISPTLDPASSLEIGNQSADCALLEHQAMSQLALGQPLITGKLGQRMRHRGTHRLDAWRLITIEQAKSPHEPHHPTL